MDIKCFLDNSDLTLDHETIVPQVRPLYFSSGLHEPPQAPGWPFTVEHLWLFGGEHHSRLPLNRLHKHQIVGRPHLGVLGQELEEDRDVTFARLVWASVGVVADAPFVAADGECRRTEVFASTEALVKAVASDLERNRGPRRLRLCCAPRRHPHY
uniref:Uncharacterized protein n=1 Tax=Triticum urartu TaxID=4572 RepID=A0A8R7UBF4_TRIUA